MNIKVLFAKDVRMKMLAMSFCVSVKTSMIKKKTFLLSMYVKNIVQIIVKFNYILFTRKKLNI